MSEVVGSWIAGIFLTILLLILLGAACAYFAGDLVKKYNKVIKEEVKKVIRGNGRNVSDNAREQCQTCKYNVSCNYYEPYCDLKEIWVSDSDECPLKINNNQAARKDGKGD